LNGVFKRHSKHTLGNLCDAILGVHRRGQRAAYSGGVSNGGDALVDEVDGQPCYPRLAFDGDSDLAKTDLSLLSNRPSR
jgi:hypothetical protein